MKNLHSVSLVVLILALFAGCQSPQKGLKSVVSIGLAIDAAMTTAGELNRAGQLSNDAKAQLITLYNDWVPLYGVALTAAQAFPDKPPSPEFTAASNKLLDKASAVGVKPKPQP